jgi:hypothetical protein
MNADQIRARDAAALMANPVFKGFIKAMNENIDAKMMGMDIIDNKRCAMAIQSKQLLRAIERELARYIDQGFVEDMIENEANRKAEASSPRPMER